MFYKNITSKMKKYNLVDFNYFSFQVVAPEIKVANIDYNTSVIINEINKYADNTNLIIFPELILTGASCGDLFFTKELIEKIEPALNKIIEETYKKNTTIILGTPFLISNKLYNVAMLISNGKIIGIVPSRYKTRWFEEYFYQQKQQHINNILFNDYYVPFDVNLTFTCKDFNNCKLMLLIGEPNIDDFARCSNVQIVINLNSNPFNIEKTSTELIKQLSVLNRQGIIYVNSNASESTTDYVYGDQLVACEVGEVINKVSTLQLETQNLKAEFDLDIINSLQRKYSKNKSNIEFNVDFYLNREIKDTLTRKISKSPYLKNDLVIEKQVKNIFEMQALALAKRLKSINTNKIVLGISGGIDSTLALLVAIRTFEILHISKKNIFTIIMPGFATTNKTKNNSYNLVKLLDTNIIEIPINETVYMHLKDIGHSIENKNIVYENAQARMRSMILFNYANKVGGIVVGTGDASEIALGWSTFNGDHISNYNVNAGIPKTIAKEIIRYFTKNEIEKGTAVILEDILNTPISPELVSNDNDKIEQETEKIIGPYILNDFFLWYLAKYNLDKRKIKFLAENSFDEFSSNEIEQWLNLFFKRFYSSQYKRSCSTDGPTIFGFSLSPRGELMLPSDLEEYN